MSLVSAQQGREAQTLLFLPKPLDPGKSMSTPGWEVEGAVETSMLKLASAIYALQITIIREIREE